MISVCGTCKQPVRLAETPDGRVLVLDGEPAPNGTVRLAFAIGSGSLPRALEVPESARVALVGELYRLHRCQEPGG